MPFNFTTIQRILFAHSIVSPKLQLGCRHMLLQPVIVWQRLPHWPSGWCAYAAHSAHQGTAFVLMHIIV